MAERRIAAGPWWAILATLLVAGTAACGGAGGDTTDEGADVDAEGVEGIEDIEDIEDGEGVPDRGEADDAGDVEIPEDAADGEDAGPPPSCGDGITDPGEECDDGNAVDTDDCTNACRLPVCGDGIVWDGHEECDDGTGNSDTLPDACRTSCRSASCGDGVQDTPEGCDDGNTAAGDGCGPTCVPETCGDGIVQPPEQCDDGTGNSDTLPDACRTNCRSAYCSDGVRDTGEECDDGNLADGDGCSNSCTLEACGNGRVDGGEECDDGNAVDTDDCTNACRRAVCGDGIVWAGHEQCDGEAPRSCTTTCSTSGTQACTACTWEAVCTPPAETCNAADDDCDTVADNGFACVQGAAVSCTTTCGSTGTGICTATCELPTGTACTPPAETCNGTDDDCDTVTDEGYDCVRGSTVACTTTCGSTGSGTCSDTCTVPTGSACTPPAETCNAADDDCDTVADDGFACVRGAAVSCTTTCGTTGTGTCTATCELPTGAACTPPAETCNGTDDDCDTVRDDGFACVLGATQPCTVGACTGTQTCLAPSCSWGTCSFGAAPLNDTCAGSIPDISGGGVFTGSTCAAAGDYTYSCGSTIGGSPDVVFQLTLPGTRDVILDTVGSTFDAMLFIRSAGACPGTTLARCDDNTAGSGQARIQWTSMPAGTYWVILDGAGAGNRGDYVLNVVVSTPPPPANDNCADATSLTLSGTLQAVFGNTTSATSDNVTCSGTDGAPDVWYTFTIPAGTNHVVYFDTVDGGTWDSVLHLRQGSCSGPTVAGGCADDACGGRRSQMVVVLTPGTYYLAVDGYDASASGTFVLRYQASPCTAGTVIRGDGTYCGSTVGAGNDSRGSCGGFTAEEVYYFLGVCPSRTVTATTCNERTDYDTVLYARRGTCAGTEVACNDDVGGSCTVGVGGNSSGIQWSSATWGQGLYYVTVDGAGGDEGNFCLTVSGM